MLCCNNDDIEFILFYIYSLEEMRKVNKLSTKVHKYSLNTALEHIRRHHEYSNLIPFWNRNFPLLLLVTESTYKKSSAGDNL
jgi:hypothetical protein